MVEKKISTCGARCPVHGVKIVTVKFCPACRGVATSAKKAAASRANARKARAAHKGIQDEFTHLKVSRQRKHQLRAAKRKKEGGKSDAIEKT